MVCPSSHHLGQKGRRVLPDAFFLRRRYCVQRSIIQRRILLVERPRLMMSLPHCSYSYSNNKQQASTINIHILIIKEEAINCRNTSASRYNTALHYTTHNNNNNNNNNNNVSIVQGSPRNGGDSTCQFSCQV
jgi:hypothetical protein